MTSWLMLPLSVPPLLLLAAMLYSRRALRGAQAGWLFTLRGVLFALMQILLAAAGLVGLAMMVEVTAYAKLNYAKFITAVGFAINSVLLLRFAWLAFRAAQTGQAQTAPLRKTLIPLGVAAGWCLLMEIIWAPLSPFPLAACCAVFQYCCTLGFCAGLTAAPVTGGRRAALWVFNLTVIAALLGLVIVFAAQSDDAAMGAFFALLALFPLATPVMALIRLAQRP